MKSRICRFLRQGISPQATGLAAILLAALMIFTAADQTTCFVALALLMSVTRKGGECRLFGRNRS